MRILHVLDHGLPLQSGYTFRTRAILKAQIARGWQVAAVTGPRQGASEAAVEDIDGLTFHRTTGGRSGGIIGEALGLAAFARRIARACDDFQPDVIHAHSPVLDALAALPVARLRGLPLVYEIRAFWEDAAVGNGTGCEGSLRYRATRALESWAVARADAVAVICEGLRGDLIARGVTAEKVVVSPNGVDLTLFGTPAPRDPELAHSLGLEGADVVGFIGSFYDYEGLDDLIAAMPALVARRPQARLVLVGGGPMEAALRMQAAASPAARAIRFVGRVPHDEVERYYALVDVLVYPRKAMRLTELVTPLKPLEAMAQGRLVAASDVGGHRELIRATGDGGDTGTLFRPDDSQAIADALDGLFADRAGWDARRARARAFVEAERNWSSNIAVYQPVYQGLARPHGTIMAAFPRFSPKTVTLGPRAAPIGAAAAGALTAALCLMLPNATLEGWVLASGLPALVAAAAAPLGATARAVLALAGGAMAASVVWSLLYLLTGPEGLIGHKGLANALLALRRAGARPDLPPRKPMTAAEMGTPLMEVTAPLVEQDLPADLDQPLAAFDPGALLDVPMAPTEPVAPLVRTVLAPGERIDTYVLSPPPPVVAPEPPRASTGVQPSIDALLRRLEEVAAQRVGVPAR